MSESESDGAQSDGSRGSSSYVSHFRKKRPKAKQARNDGRSSGDSGRGSRALAIVIVLGDSAAVESGAGNASQAASTLAARATTLATSLLRSIAGYESHSSTSHAGASDATDTGIISTLLHEHPAVRPLVTASLTTHITSSEHNDVHREAPVPTRNSSLRLHIPQRH